MPGKGSGNLFVLPSSSNNNHDADAAVASAVAAAAAMAASHHHNHGHHNKDNVDNLVIEIKENLKLGSPSSGSAGGGKVKTGKKKGSRGSFGGSSVRSIPYQVPPSSRVPCDNVDQKCQSQLRKWNHQRRRYPSTCMASTKGEDIEAAAAAASETADDPFKMLQELITDGSLIKEAVRRLQLGLTPKYSLVAAARDEEEEQDDRSFYDSDEEDCHTPPAFKITKERPAAEVV